jgi:hypothetical protein
VEKIVDFSRVRTISTKEAKMKYVLLVLKIITAPIWIPLWLMKKGGRLLTVLFLGAILGGCVSMSNGFDKSPCACDFKPLNTSNYGGMADA